MLMELRGRKIGLLIFTLMILFVSCQNQEVLKPVIYNGPMSEVDDIETYYTENDHVKVKLVARKVLQFQNGDREFPEGIYIENYDATGKLISTLRANSAFYFNDESKWRARGKVELKNIEKNEELNTEELFWKPDTRKIFTDKFVRIKRQNNGMYGTGLNADQDLSSLELNHVEGEFEVDENGDADLNLLR
jgi:LPS export ABC transporter protein LptC